VSDPDLDFFSSPELVRYVRQWSSGFVKHARIEVLGTSGVPLLAAQRERNKANWRLCFVAAVALADVLSDQFPELLSPPFERAAKLLSQRMRHEYELFRRNVETLS
jgi:hypothetical protein